MVGGVCVAAWIILERLDQEGAVDIVAKVAGFAIIVFCTVYCIRCTSWKSGYYQCIAYIEAHLRNEVNERYPNVSWKMRERSVRVGKDNYIRCRDIVVFPTYGTVVIFA